MYQGASLLQWNAGSVAQSLCEAFALFVSNRIAWRISVLPNILGSSASVTRTPCRLRNAPTLHSSNRDLTGNGDLQCSVGT